MKNNLLPIGLSAYTIGIIILIIFSFASCASNCNTCEGAYLPNYAEENVELQNLNQ